MHTFVMYNDGKYGLDTVLAIMNRNQPQINYNIFHGDNITEEFLFEAIQKERELVKFLKRYYNMLFTQRYKNFGKECRIKEL